MHANGCDSCYIISHGRLRQARTAESLTSHTHWRKENTSCSCSSTVQAIASPKNGTLNRVDSSENILMRESVSFYKRYTFFHPWPGRIRYFENQTDTSSARPNERAPESLKALRSICSPRGVFDDELSTNIM